MNRVPINFFQLLQNNFQLVLIDLRIREFRSVLL